jgi:hypothetical protein
MTNLLQKLVFWRHGDKPESAPAVSEQRPNPSPTPEQDADALRREALRKDDRKLEERDEFPTRPNYEP